MNKKETFWLFGTVVLILIINTLISGIDGIKADSTLDINIHDTYFVFGNYHFILLIGVPIFFGIYLVRSLRRNFKNLMANLILMISTMSLIVVLIGISSILETAITQTKGWTIIPPISASEIAIEPKKNSLGIVSSLLFYAQIVLLVFLAYSGFKTGQNYKQKRK